MLSQRLRLWFALVFLGIGAGLLIAAAISFARVQQVLPFRPAALPEWPLEPSGGLPGSDQLERRVLILEWPEKLPEQDSGLVRLTLALEDEGVALTAQPPGDGTPVEFPDIYETHHIVAVARLDMAGMEAYRDDVREPMLPGQEVTFRWSVRPAEAGVYRGIVWLHLEFVPRAGGQVERTLVLSRTIEIEAVSILGLPGGLVRVLGVLGLVISTLLGYPFIQNLVGACLKKRNKPDSAAPAPEQKKRPAKKEAPKPEK
jgi:hypothetical protein